MSAATHEAEDGPDLSSEDSSLDEASAESHDGEVSPEDDLPTPRLGKFNGVREDDGHASGGHNQNPESDDSNSLVPSRPDAGRPSSADGSLSIPDDPPSVRVSMNFLSEAVISLTTSGIDALIVAW